MKTQSTDRMPSLALEASQIDKTPKPSLPVDKAKISRSSNWYGQLPSLLNIGIGFLALSRGQGVAGRSLADTNLLDGLQPINLPAATNGTAYQAIAVRCPDEGSLPSWGYGVAQEGELEGNDWSCATLSLRNSYAFDGFANDKLFVYDEQEGNITRYGVNEAVALAAEQTLSLPFRFRDQSRPSIQTLYINETLALTLANPQIDVASNVVTWDPSNMQVLQANGTQALLRNDPYRPITLVGQPRLFGDYAAFPLSYTSLGATKIEQEALVLLIDPTNLTRPATLVRDKRCMGAKSAFVGPDEALYVASTGNDGWFARSGEYFPETPVKTACLLRIKAGETSFDPNYLLDLHALLNTTGIGNVYPIGGNQTLVAWLSNINLADSNLALSKTDFVQQARYQLAKVDLAGGVTQLPGNWLSALVSNLTLELDDKTVLQLRNGSARTTPIELLLTEEDGLLQPLTEVEDAVEVVGLGYVS